MCGIFGVLSFLGEPDIKKAEIAVNTLKHRGPDNQSCEKVTSNLIFGHTRLSIIDVGESSNQPFKKNNVTLVFNGEIFNYIELREQLIKEGYKFTTSGDVEVLLVSYLHYGFECTKYLNGMWAFALYDHEKDLIFASRDRYGIKPFVYNISHEGFLFGSESKALLKYRKGLDRPNYELIANFVRNSVGAQTNFTWFDGIHRLMPGHNIILKNKSISINKYYNLPHEYHDIPYKDAVNKYYSLFEKSVKLRMRSDVPVGTTLSSGIDSTSIVSVLRTFFKDNHHTYTASFENNLADKKIYKSIVNIREDELVIKLGNELNLDTNILNINNHGYLDQLKSTLYYLESGHSSPAIIPVEQLYSAASKDVKVVLEGQGADEILGGYIASTFVDSILSDVNKIKFVDAYNNFKLYKSRYSISYAVSMYFRQHMSPDMLRVYYNLNQFENIFGSDLKNKTIIPISIEPQHDESNSFRRGLHSSITGTLVDLLHYGDALSMKNSIEARCPFLDHELVDFVMTLPDNFKVRHGLGKYIHRDAMKGIVPNYILDNKYKFGFNTPINELFMKNNSERLYDYMLDVNCHELFNQTSLERLLNDHNTGKQNARLLFRILSTLIWKEMSWS